MKNSYKNLISEAHKKIKIIRRDAQTLITDVQIGVLYQAKRNFKALGWTQYWTKDQLIADGQFERLEQSVMDTNLRLVEVDKYSQTGIINDSSTIYEVSGQGCSCADFVFRGLPCKHMYFLVGVLTEHRNG